MKYVRDEWLIAIAGVGTVIFFLIYVAAQH